jgi:hypothetical protein
MPSHNLSLPRRTVPSALPMQYSLHRKGFPWLKSRTLAGVKATSVKVSLSGSFSDENIVTPRLCQD